ncbi:hypothetical protein [Paucibacter sp. B51]|uniref:hypothetical protein n=1 Tax=Paucibacter sp. B51 TaxID=2993315 RepID=UPI0022EC08C1|nr:hypothetical protein [Paucibacter sp. B51]
MRFFELFTVMVLAGASSFTSAAPSKLEPGRCPVKPPPQLSDKRLPNGEFFMTARYLLKADGAIEQITVEGKGPESFRRAIADAIRAYDCVPAAADQEIESEFWIRIS